MTWATALDGALYARYMGPGGLSRLHGIAGLPVPGYDVWVPGSLSPTLDRWR